MTQPSAAQSIDSLLRESTTLDIALANLHDQLEATRDRRKQVRAAIEGVKLGQALAAESAQVAAEASAPADAA